MLKEDTADMLSKLSLLNIKVFISDPLPPVGKRENSYSKALRIWISTGCTVHSVHFIAHFNLFWDQRHLTKLNGICLNKSGVKKNLLQPLFISCINQVFSMPRERDKKDSKQEMQQAEILKKSNFTTRLKRTQTSVGRNVFSFLFTNNYQKGFASNPPYFSDLNDSCTMMW